MWMWDVRRKAFGGGKSGREWGLRCRCLEECGASGTELLDTENKLMVARGEGGVWSWAEKQRGLQKC